MLVCILENERNLVLHNEIYVPRLICAHKHMLNMSGFNLVQWSANEDTSRRPIWKTSPDDGRDCV